MSSEIEYKAKAVFASRLLSTNAAKIYEKQVKTVTEWNLFDSGELKKSLAGSGAFNVNSDDSSAKVTLRYLAYTRFLDMKDARRSRMRAGYHLYNRILFGYLYNEILPGLKYGYTPEIKEQFESEIKQAMDAGYNNEQ